jgi:hypothetical protein
VPKITAPKITWRQFVGFAIAAAFLAVGLYHVL